MGSVLRDGACVTGPCRLLRHWTRWRRGCRLVGRRLEVLHFHPDSARVFCSESSGCARRFLSNAAATCALEFEASPLSLSLRPAGPARVNCVKSRIASGSACTRCDAFIPFAVTTSDAHRLLSRRISDDSAQNLSRIPTLHAQRATSAFEKPAAIHTSSSTEKHCSSTSRGWAECPVFD
jgi:hypothetical protein